MKKDLIHKRFGSLLVIDESRRKGRRSWICKCDCGNETNVITSNLTGGKSKSCRHCTVELLAKHNKEYMVWSSMKSRCDNKNHHAYKDYGGRGITYQESWSKFENFLLDMGKKPKKLSLDRVDNNGNYTTENCRWATGIQQRNNVRTNRLLTYKGKTQTMAEWARELDINYQTLKSRLNIGGWSVKRSLTK